MKRLIPIGLLCVGFAAGAPDAPQGVTASGPGMLTVLAVRVSWQDCRRESSYAIERSDWDGWQWSPWHTVGTMPQNATAFTDIAPFWGTPMAYRVLAINKHGATASAAVPFTLQ